MAHTDPSANIPMMVAGFNVLLLSLPPMPSFPTASSHYLYIRSHEPKVPDTDTPRSLFAVNVPIDATEASFRALFADQLGGARVERVDFDGGPAGTKAKISGSTGVVPSRAGKKKRKRGAGGKVVSTGEEAPEGPRLPSVWDRPIWPSGSSAVIVFVDRASAELALREIGKSRRQHREIVWRADSKPRLGYDRYRNHQNLLYPPRSVLQAAVDSHLTAFAAYETARTRLLARQRSEPDADGFITVTRGGRTGPARAEAAQEAAKRLKERQEKIAGGNFYRFQARERKKARVEEIKKRFQEDRKRLDDIRARKRVKPM